MDRSHGCVAGRGPEGIAQMGSRKGKLVICALLIIVICAQIFNG